MGGGGRGIGICRKKTKRVGEEEDKGGGGGGGQGGRGGGREGGGGGAGENERGETKGERKGKEVCFNTVVILIVLDVGLLFHFCAFLFSCKLIIIWGHGSEATSAVGPLQYECCLHTTQF